MSSIVLALLLSTAASAGKNKEERQKEAAESAEVGGEVYAHVGTWLTEGADRFTEFDVDRAYLTVKKKMGRGFSTRVTLDAGREDPQVVSVPDGAGGTTSSTVPGDDAMRVFVKFVYLEHNSGGGVKVRAGMAPTVYPGFYDAFWGHRFVTKAFVDQFGMFSTSDIGVHALGTHGDGQLDWQAAVINGESFKHRELNGRPVAQGRFTFNPLAGTRKKEGQLPLSGVVSYAAPVEDGDPVLTWVGAGGLKVKYAVAWVEYAGRTEGDLSGSGYSATAMPRHPKVGAIVLRYDFWDPDTSTTDDATTRLIAGVSRSLHDQVTGTFTLERTTLQAAPDDPAEGVFVRMGASF